MLKYQNVKCGPCKTKAAAILINTVWALVSNNMMVLLEAQTAAKHMMVGRFHLLSILKLSLSLLISLQQERKTFTVHTVPFRGE